jgi:hypothetical protein
VVAVQPPCEQQQLVKLCYKNYEGHLGKLKWVAFLPSGPQTMNNLHYKIIDGKKLKKNSPLPVFTDWPTTYNWSLAQNALTLYSAGPRRRRPSLLLQTVALKRLLFLLFLAGGGEGSVPLTWNLCSRTRTLTRTIEPEQEQASAYRLKPFTVKWMCALSPLFQKTITILHYFIFDPFLNLSLGHAPFTRLLRQGRIWTQSLHTHALIPAAPLIPLKI